ncbi:MAG: hypothetical protein EBU31_15190, partial [Proteobacteria bacterium]|nr:hypothetical protein [Pseudomonadota bacterium]
CATGPTEMAEHIAYLSKHWDRAFSVIPNAGLPILVDGRTEYPLRPDAFGAAMRRYLEDFGAGIVGGCCGTTTDHIRALRDVVGTRSPVTRAAVRTPGCSSLYGFTEFRQDNSFLIVAERTNANGSKKFKRLLDASDWDGLVSMAKEEMRDGSHLLDVCVDFVGRDGVKDMAEVASRYVQHVNAPLMVDSTQADVIEAALKRAGGRCIVNSINLEDGEKRLDEICPLLKRYGAACVALTIDEDMQAGMAKTADRKIEIASRIHDLFTRKWGLDENDLFFDPLTFTIATGNDEDRRLGLETLEGIRRISETFPKCQILLGLSNISFGLKPAAPSSTPARSCPRTASRPSSGKRRSGSSSTAAAPSARRECRRRSTRSSTSSGSSRTVPRPPRCAGRSPTSPWRRRCSGTSSTARTRTSRERSTAASRSTARSRSSTSISWPA